MLEEPSRILLPLAARWRPWTRRLDTDRSGLRAGPAAALRRRRRPLFPAGRQRRPHHQARRAGVIYDVRHRTTYTYERGDVHALRAAPDPANLGRPDVLEAPRRHAAALATVNDRPVRRTDATVIIEEPHRALIIEARSRVDVQRRRRVPGGQPRLGAVRAQLRPRPRADSPAAFLYPTARTPLAPAITDYARASFTRPADPGGGGRADGPHAPDFTYDPEATDVSTPPAQAFAARRGVCQDFAHIMICGLRGLGLPAAYVTGYLRTIPPPGRPRLEGADATHAWVRLWCGEERGWIGSIPPTTSWCRTTTSPWRSAATAPTPPLSRRDARAGRTDAEGRGRRHPRRRARRHSSSLRCSIVS